MKFNFRLEKLLHFVELREANKKMEIAYTTQRIGILRSRQNDLEKESRKLLTERHLDSQFGSGWSQYRNQRLSMNREQGMMLDIMARRDEQTLADLKGDLSRIILRRKALESLKEKKLSDFKLKKNRKDQSSQEELFRVSRGRERRSG